MAQRVKADDLQKLIEEGEVFLSISSTTVDQLERKPGIWHILGYYKNAHSANASASIYRKKLGAGFRVKSIGHSVYVIFDGVPAVQGATALEVAA